MRLVLPPAAPTIPSLSNIEICRSRFGARLGPGDLAVLRRSRCPQPRKFRSCICAKSYRLHSRREHVRSAGKLLAFLRSHLSRAASAGGKASAQGCDRIPVFST
jgi:hypothetical protein